MYLILLYKFIVLSKYYFKKFRFSFTSWYNNKFLQTATVICASLETDIIPKPITKFTDLAVFYVKRTMRSFIYYYNKFNVYKKKIIASFYYLYLYPKLNIISVISCVVWFFFIGKLSNLYFFLLVAVMNCIPQEKNESPLFSSFIWSSLASSK